uniref:Uncharacterized protein n=1 Tax=Calcidiscus leptoporus TaxID=127549 RepID=A0A7S0NS75_9EUKA|mmetsp:Transcript_19813/g.45650  ORF Transcript_19813/g.45650 Transcript_19813/m.45650 type:complete len:242 (+) Transcript_19813:14-739(+)
MGGGCASVGLLDIGRINNAIARAPLRWPSCSRLGGAANCAYFFVRMRQSELPCEWNGHVCVASLTAACANVLKDNASRASPPALVQDAGRRRARLLRRLRRVSLKHIGTPCASSIEGDLHYAECEGWCSNSSMDHCKFCKCRGCRSCYELPMPSWAHSSPLALLSTCTLFGEAVCNRTANFNLELQQAWRKWNYNRTSQWIDDLFASVYRQSLVGFVAQTVSAEEGLSDSEKQQLAAAKAT